MELTGNVSGLINLGGGGSSVEVTPILTSGEHIADIEVNGVTSELYAPEAAAPTEVEVTQVLTTGTKIATIGVDGVDVDLYAPEGGGSIDYSTSEQETGDKWIDGKKRYRRTINLGSVSFGGFDYDYTYKGAFIGVSYHDWYDNRQWYEFYFDTRAKAQQFYTTLTTDLRQAGFPMVKDKIYGGMTTRNQSVALFKEIYVFQPNLIKKADPSNVHREDVVGKYVVELGVYWR